MSMIGEGEGEDRWYVVSLEAETLKFQAPTIVSRRATLCGESPATYLKWHLNFCRRPGVLRAPRYRAFTPR